MRPADTALAGGDDTRPEQPATDRVIEGVPMRGTMLEYRERQLVALEKFAGEMERALRRILRDQDRPTFSMDKGAYQDARELLGRP